MRFELIPETTPIISGHLPSAHEPLDVHRRRTKCLQQEDSQCEGYLVFVKKVFFILPLGLSLQTQDCLFAVMKKRRR